jgi:hypothetical protein
LIIYCVHSASANDVLDEDSWALAVASDVSLLEKLTNIGDV